MVLKLLKSVTLSYVFRKGVKETDTFLTTKKLKSKQVICSNCCKVYNTSVLKEFHATGLCLACNEENEIRPKQKVIKPLRKLNFNLGK